jgi:DHA1 family multidrug resistance protein-like MFS transporter
LGFFYGGIIPTANTIISLSTPPQDRGKVFGIANSTTFLGDIFGPIAGGFIITTFNLTAVFVFTGGILLLAGLALPAIIKKSEKIKTAK